MKYLFAAIVLIFWMIATILLCLSVVGIMIAADDSWAIIPEKLLEVFKN